MKSKIVFGLILVSFIATGCNNSSKVKYTLKDTWGADGNWGNQTTKVAKETSHKEATPHKAEPVKVASKPKAEAHNTETHSEAPTHAAPKAVQHENSAPAEAKTAYKWEKREATGMLKASYVKEIPDDSLNFSYGIINNTKVDSKFKSDYKAKLSKAITGVAITSDKEESVKNKKSWTLTFSYDKDGTKVKQKQVFIPVEKNLVVVNFIASDKGFNKVEDEFKSITNNLKL